MDSTRKFSRRNLLRIAAGTGVAFSVLGLAACAPAAAPSPTTAPAAPTTAPAAAATATTAPAAAATPTTAAKPTAAPTTAAAGSPTAAATAAAKPTEAASAATPTAPPMATASTASTTYKMNTAASGNVRWQFRGSADDLKGAQTFVDTVFAKAYPNVKLTVELAPADQRDAKLITAMVGGNAPDIFETWSDNVTQFADKGQVLDVEPLSKSDYTADQLADFYPWQWHDFMIPTSSGTQLRFGLPKYVNVMFTWYNKDLFDAAGQKYPDDTWDHTAYANAAIAMQKYLGSPNFGLLYPVWSWDRFWYTIEAWGGTVRDPSDNTLATFDSDIAMQAWEWSRKLLWDDKAMAQQLLLMGTGQSYDSVALFASKRYAMNEEGFYPFSMAKNINKQFKWAYSPVPKGPAKRRVLGTTDGFSQWKGSKTQDASWEVLKWLAGKDYQVNQCKTTGLLPIRFSALTDWKKICTDAYPELADVNLDVGPQAMEQGYPGNRLFFKKDADSRQIMEPALQKVYVSGGTPVTYFKDIAKQVTAKNRA